MGWLFLLLACHDKGDSGVALESDTDTDSDSDTDTDSDTDADTDTDTDTDPGRKPLWSWGATNTGANADASIVGFEPSPSLASATSAGDIDGDGIAELGITWGPEACFFVPSSHHAWALEMPVDPLPVLRWTFGYYQSPVFLGDVDGDGMADVATQGNRLVLGRSDLSENPTLVPNVAVNDPSLSSALYTYFAVGDMDGDGRNEWMLQYDHGSDVYVFSGAVVSSSHGELTAPEDAMWALSAPTDSDPTLYAGVDDVTGDGLADIVGTRPLSPLWLLEGGYPAEVGDSIADIALASFSSACGGLPSWQLGPGDMDDDEVSELSTFVSGCDGGYYVYRGGETLSGDLDTSDAALFSESKVYRAGDVNGDGWTELKYADGLVLGSGALPAAITADDVVIHSLSSALFGNEQLPDVNGDGIGDVVRYAGYDESAGTQTVEIVLGRTVWPSTVTDEEVDATFVTPITGNDWIDPLTMDLDDDGFDDLVVGSTGDQAVYIFFGQP